MQPVDLRRSRRLRGLPPAIDPLAIVEQEVPDAALIMAANNQQVPAEVFAANPFATNINPATTQGLKLWQAATASRDDADKLVLKISKAKEFIDAMKQDAAQFSWGTLTSQINDGTQVRKDLIRDVRMLTLDHVRGTMKTIFQTPTAADPLSTTHNNPTMFAIDPANTANDRPIFYNRVRANMIGLRIYNSLAKSSLTELKLKSHLFTWRSATGEVFYDGVVMLYLILTKVTPHVRVGVSDLKKKLRNARLPNFNHSVPELTDFMQSQYDEIIEKGRTHDDYVLDLFAALLSGKNDKFNTAIEAEQRRWERGDTISHEDLIATAVSLYNNMYAAKTWKTQDGKDAKIVALTTQLKNLEDKFKNGSSSKSSGSGNDKDGVGKYGIAKWRFSKTLGAKVSRDGKDYWWCTQHMGGKGLYVTHKPEDHGQSRRAQADKDGSGGKSKDKSSNDKKKSLTLSDSLKAAMVTKFKCSEDDAKQLWKQCVSESGGEDF